MYAQDQQLFSEPRMQPLALGIGAQARRVVELDGPTRSGSDGNNEGLELLAQVLVGFGKG